MTNKDFDNLTDEEFSEVLCKFLKDNLDKISFNEGYAGYLFTVKTNDHECIFWNNYDNYPPHIDLETLDGCIDYFYISSWSKELKELISFIEIGHKL